MRKTIVAALAALLLIGSAPSAQAATGGNIYNLSDHGMWMVKNWPAGKPNQSYAGLITNDLMWVPAKTWSSAGGWQDTDGYFSGAGWCVQQYQSVPGGWKKTFHYRGPVTVKVADTPEWMVWEYPC